MYIFQHMRLYNDYAFLLGKPGGSFLGVKWFLHIASTEISSNRLNSNNRIGPFIPMNTEVKLVWI